MPLHNKQWGCVKSDFLDFLGLIAQPLEHDFLSFLRQASGHEA